MNNVIKITNEIRNDVIRTSKKAAEKVTNEVTSEVPDAVMKTVLDAKSSYGQVLVNKCKLPKWKLHDSEAIRLREILKGRIYNGDEAIDDEVAAFIVKNLYGENAWSRRDIRYSMMLFGTLQNTSLKKRNLIFNSDYLNLAYKKVKEDSKANLHAFMNKSFDWSEDEIKKLDKIVQDKLSADFALNFTANNKDYFKPEKLFKEIEPIQNFTQIKNSSKFIGLLSQRECRDMAELSKIIGERLSKCKSENEVKDLYNIVKKLSEAKTPKGEFIFSASKASDTSRKMITDGIKNFLNAKDNDPQKFEQLMNLLQLTEEGKIPPHIIGILPENSQILPLIQEEINKAVSEIPSVSKFTDKLDALKNSLDGEVVRVGKKLSVKQNSKLIPLKMDENTFLELFPAIEKYALGQGELGNCYFVSAVFDFMKNPEARGHIYQMFEQEGDDIIVRIPDAIEYPIVYSKKALQKDGQKNINASLGIQMLEDAYTKTRSLKYGVSANLKSIEGGSQCNVYDTLLGIYKSKSYTNDPDFKETTKQDVEDMIKISKEFIENNKSKIKDIKYKQNPNMIEELEFSSNEALRNDVLQAEAVNRYAHEALQTLDSQKQVSDSEMVNNLIKFGNDKNYLVSLGAKQGKEFFKEKLIYGGHAYSIDKVDAANKTVNVVNPWNTSQSTTLTFDEFLKYFNTINVVEL